MATPGPGRSIGPLPTVAPLSAISADTIQPASGSLDLPWNRQRITEKVRSVRGFVEGSGDPIDLVPAPYLLRRDDRRHVPRDGRRVDRTPPVSVRRSAASTWPKPTGRPRAVRSHGLPHDEAPKRQRRSPQHRDIRALQNPNPPDRPNLPNPDTQPAAAVIHCQISRASSASSASTSTIDGLKRAVSSGSSSARTRLRGMQTSALVSSSTNVMRRSPSHARSSSRRHAEQRPDDVALARIHRGEPARAGAAHQPQQKRLGLIVARVAERDDVGAEMLRARARRTRGAPCARHPRSSAARGGRARPRPRVRRTAARRSPRRRRPRTVRRSPPTREADD